MNDFPLQRIIDFLQTVVPFDTLNHEELKRVAGKMEIAYYPRGQAIIRRGESPPGYLHIIQVGSARITISDESEGDILVDLRGPGDVFGAVSLLKGKEALFDVTAEKDIIAFMLPAHEFKELVEAHPSFRRTFSLSLARNIKAVRQSGDRQLSQLAGVEAVKMDFFLIGKRITDLMTRNVLTCSPSISIREAAQKMSRLQVGSIVVAGEMGNPLGIITDRDIRSKVVAGEYGREALVTEIMSHPPHTIAQNAYAFDGLLLMSHFGINHLLVTENERMVGIISEHDFQLQTGNSPIGVIRGIDKAQSVDELMSSRNNIDNVREMLLRQGGAVNKMVELITELNDRVTRKLLKLTELEIDNDGMGRAPVSYCWMSLGSEGRREQTIRTDQDNALVFTDVAPKEEPEIKAWFINFAERVVEGLVRYGFPRCPGGIMASNPRWCKSEAAWQEDFLGWIHDPNPLTLRMASIFFDFRALYDGIDFLEGLRSRIDEAIDRNPLFLRFMAKNALYNRPPLGLLRNFVVETSGEHKNKLNLKNKGLVPVVDCIRILALDQHVKTTNTTERIEEINDRGIINDEFKADLSEAYNFMNYLRIKHHLNARAAMTEPDNFLDPSALNSLQRRMLKESFGVVSRLQGTVEYRYQAGFIVET